MTERVRWPNGWEGGVLVGRDAVREYWTRQWAAIDPHVEPRVLRIDGADAVVTVHQRVLDKDGVVLSDRDVVHAYTFERERVAAMEIREP
jgi:hypothetical protein